MRRLTALTLASVLLVSACATTPVPDVGAALEAKPAVEGPLYPQGEKDTCGAAAYIGLIGKPVTSDGVPAPDKLVRHIKPDSVITMEFSEKRLNLYVSKVGVIQKLTCA